MRVRGPVKRRWHGMVSMPTNRSASKIVWLSLFGLAAFFVLHSNRTSNSQCQISLGKYGGKIYAQKDTLGSKCLVESKFLKVQQHKVRVPGSDAVIDDWLWIDYHDRINVLVENERKLGEERKFLVFEQSKYALEERSSLAIVGGIIEPGESAEKAARREVEEETGSLCETFHFLGRFRTDVNRGMGWVNSFLATNCRPLKAETGETQSEEAEEVGAADMEHQNHIVVSIPQLREAARNGQFLEVQWSNTVSLALLHEELSVIK